MTLDTEAPKGWCLVQRGCIVRKLGPCRTHASHRCYRQLQSTHRRPEAAARSHIHPNNSRLPALPTDCSVVALVPETEPAVSPSIAANQGESTHFSWHGVMKDENNFQGGRWCHFNGTSGFYLVPFLSQSRQSSWQHGFCPWVLGHDGGS